VKINTKIYPKKRLGFIVPHPITGIKYVSYFVRYMQVFTTGILVSATKKDELPWNETSKLPLGVNFCKHKNLPPVVVWKFHSMAVHLFW
jgi:hypothetical protein